MVYGTGYGTGRTGHSRGLVVVLDGDGCGVGRERE
jgi:hypothetical protein